MSDCHIITLSHYHIVTSHYHIVRLPHYHVVTLSHCNITLSHCQIRVFAYFVFIFRGFQLIREICTVCKSTHFVICTVFRNQVYLRQIVIIIQMNAVNEGFLFKLKWMPEKNCTSTVSSKQSWSFYFTVRPNLQARSILINLSGRVERVN